MEDQSSAMELRFLMVRVLVKMRKIQEVRDAFDEILTLNPLTFELLVENVLLMGCSCEPNKMIYRLRS